MQSTHFEVEYRMSKNVDDERAWLPAGGGRFGTYMEALAYSNQCQAEADPGAIHTHVVEVTKSWSLVYQR